LFGRVDGQGRERRKDFAVEALGKRPPIHVVQLLPSLDDDARGGQFRHELLLPAALLGGDQRVGLAEDLQEEFAGRRMAGGFLLLHDAGYADLEELIEVRADDGKEADALEERHRGVFRELEHASVKTEPTEFAVKHRAW